MFWSQELNSVLLQTFIASFEAFKNEMHFQKLWFFKESYFKTNVLYFPTDIHEGMIFWTINLNNTIN